MTGRIYFLFISTFLMGMLVGAYVYVSIYAPAYESGTDSDAEVGADSFVIDAQMYGGCSEAGACASFRLVDGRSYSFAAYPEAEVKEGKLSRAIEEELRAVLSEASLIENARPIAPSSCDAYVDGIDYSYTVMLNGETYQLDTCTTSLARNLQLQDTLLEIWYLIENPQLRPEENVEFDLSGLLKDRFQNPQ